MLPTRNISKKAKQFKTISELQEEFRRKNRILEERYEKVAPLQYLEDVMKKEKYILVIGRDKQTKEKGTVIRIDSDEIWNYAIKDNVYMPYADFYNCYYSAKTVSYVRAFVVDIDNVYSSKLKYTLKYFFREIPLLPSYIVNSGQGVHIVYALREKQEVKGLGWTISELNNRIQSFFEGVGGKLDRHTVVQPYRFPGFSTKIQTVATAFAVSEKYTFDELLNAFFMKVKVTEKNEKKRQKKDIVYMPNGSRYFWEYVLRRLYSFPPIPGRRHNSFFGFGLVSYKCMREVARDEAEDAVEMIYDRMKEYGLDKGFELHEAIRAFRKGYNQKAVMAPWKFVVEKFGWEYKPNKRNYRNRREHLRYVARIKKLKKEENEEKIKKMIEQGYTKTMIAKTLKISRQALYKTYGHLF